jgi:hypothetical protein
MLHCCAQAAPGSDSLAIAACPAGQHVVGGGAKVDNPSAVYIDDSYPDAGNTAWAAHVGNADTAIAHDFTVYAICITASTIG